MKDNIDVSPMVLGMFVEIRNHSNKRHMQWVDNQKLVHMARRQNMRAEFIIENDISVGSRLYLMREQKTGEYIIPPFFLEICAGAEFLPFVQVSQVVHNAGRSIRNPLDVVVNVHEYLTTPGVDDFSRVICAADGSRLQWGHLDAGAVVFYVNTFPFFSIWVQCNRGTHVSILRHEFKVSPGGTRLSVTGALWYQDTLAAFRKESSRPKNAFFCFREAVMVASDNIDSQNDWRPYADDKID